MLKTIGYVTLHPDRGDARWSGAGGEGNYALFGDLPVIEVVKVLEEEQRSLLKKHPDFWRSKDNHAFQYSEIVDGEEVYPYLWMYNCQLIPVGQVEGPNKEKKSFLQRMED